MTTPKVLTEAGQALPRPVSSSDALKAADVLLAFEIAGLGKAVAKDVRDIIRTLVSERDALASRVRELEADRDAAKADARRRFALLDSIHASFEMGRVTSEDHTAETLQDLMEFEMNRAAVRCPAIEAALTANTSGADHE